MSISATTRCSDSTPLTAADLKARSLPEFDTSRHQFGGALGGPIIRDRLHFFVAAEQTSEDEPYRVQTGRADFYGKHEGVFPDTRRDRLFFVRGDMQLNGSQNAFARCVPGQLESLRRGGGAAYQGSDTYIPRAALVAGHTWVMGTRYLNEFRFQWGGQSQYQGQPARRYGRTTRTSGRSGSSICRCSTVPQLQLQSGHGVLRSPRACETGDPERLLDLDFFSTSRSAARIRISRCRKTRRGIRWARGSSPTTSLSITRTRRCLPTCAGR